MFNRKKQPAIRSLIAEATRLDGDLRFTDGLRIDGVVTGNVQAESGKPSLLVISETATVKGEVHAQHIIVNGTVKGPVFAAVMLELQPKARIEGDIVYTGLEMHEGAIVAGQLLPASADKPVLKLAANNS